MIWRVVLAVLLTASLSLFLLTAPHAQFNGCSAGFCSPPSKSSSPSYTGPGDVVNSAFAWWGLRGYNAAFSGNAVRLCTPSDAACEDEVISGGNLVLGTVGSTCNNSTVVCTIKTLYDQSGANSCAGACDGTQATITSRAVFTTGCLGALPCMTLTSAGKGYVTGSASLAQPYTITAAVKRTGNFTAYNTILANNLGTSGLYFLSTGNADALINNTDHLFTASNSNWHALQMVANSTTSSGTTDGSTTAISAATTAFISAASMLLLNDGSDPMVGTVVEIGIWGNAFSSGQLSSVNSNIHGYWGF